MNLPHLFLSLHGRIPRSHFWTGIGVILFFQFLVLIPLVNAYAIDLDRGPAPLWFRNISLLLDIICSWPIYAVMAKRLEDRDQNGHMAFILVALLLLFSTLEAFGLTQNGREYSLAGYATGLPLLLIACVAVFELGIRRGTPGPNRFGPEPS